MRQRGDLGLQLRQGGKRRFAAWPLGMATSTRDCPPIEKLVEMTAANFLELTRAAPPSTLNQPA